MPHDGLYDVTCTAVVQTVVGTRQSAAQSTSPEWGSAAPACADVVHHKQTVLYHVGIRPDDLIRIAGQHTLIVLTHAAGISLDRGIHPWSVLASGPRRTVTACTANLIEQLLATLYVAAVQVAGSRHGQSAVPDHKLIVLLVAHLRLAVVPLVVELVRRWVQQMAYGIADASSCAVSIVRRCRVGLDGRNDVGILRHSLCPGGCGVELRTVGARHVGDVPDGHRLAATHASWRR